MCRPVCSATIGGNMTLSNTIQSDCKVNRSVKTCRLSLMTRISPSLPATKTVSVYVFIDHWYMGCVYVDVGHLSLVVTVPGLWIHMTTDPPHTSQLFLSQSSLLPVTSVLHILPSDFWHWISQQSVSMVKQLEVVHWVDWVARFEVMCQLALSKPVNDLINPYFSWLQSVPYTAVMTMFPSQDDYSPWKALPLCNKYFLAAASQLFLMIIQLFFRIQGVIGKIG